MAQETAFLKGSAATPSFQRSALAPRDGQQGAMCRSFVGASHVGEHVFALTAPGELDFREQIAHIESCYAEAMAGLGLSPETAVFRRVFLSDALNQAEVIRRSSFAQETTDNPVAISIIQQPPMPYAKLAMIAYHVEALTPLVKTRPAPHHVVIERGAQRHLWSTRLCAQDTDKAFSSATQTHSVFENLLGVLTANGATLADNCVRTWLYIKGIDMFYQGLVDCRREWFVRHGLTADTHYIASTGIEGAGAHRHDLVTMDAYSILGLKPEQVSYLNDFEHLCPTKDYNVTFERGTRIAFADRCHHYISGTASIDKAGDVVHPGNVLLQVERTVENIEALLRSGSGALDDLLYIIVYLRDPADYGRIAAFLAERLPGLPSVIVQAPVCRPDWLIEIEGIAATGNDQKDLPAF